MAGYVVASEHGIMDSKKITADGSATLLGAVGREDAITGVSKHPGFDNREHEPPAEIGRLDAHSFPVLSWPDPNH